MAELLGKATGICKGKGGSMHLTDFQVGVIGSFAIVGEGLPVAVGAALSSRMRNMQQVAVTFFGEGATNIGTFHESMNLASIWKLPVIFVCENNLYGEYTPVSKSTPINDVAQRASSYAIEGVIVDGNQVLDVYSATLNAVLKARAGEGPTMIECKTYRQRGHSRTDTGAYRPKEEVEYWLKRDPINLFRELLRRMSYLDDDLDAELTDSTSRTIEQAAKFAIESQWPGSSEACDSVYGNRLE
jgi:pyruvate dehydrogenase E1 component alpha subunit